MRSLAGHLPLQGGTACKCGWSAGLSLNDALSDARQHLRHLDAVVAEWLESDEAAEVVMTESLLDDLRALIEECLDEEGDPYDFGYATKFARGVRDLIAKREHGSEWHLVRDKETPDASERDELARAAAWVAESIGYPVQVSMPDAPMPEALWQELVDYIHADASGEWHGNEMDRDQVESWLAEEAGRRR